MFGFHFRSTNPCIEALGQGLDKEEIRLSEISDLIVRIDPQHFWALEAEWRIGIPITGLKEI